MNAQSIPAVVIASISFYVGLYHLLIYLRRKQHHEDLTFALLCLATGCYDVFCAGLYNAGSVAEGVQWQRLQFIALAFLTTAFVWFVSDYIGQRPGIVTYAFSAYYLLAVVIQCVDRNHLTWLIDQPSVKTIVLPFGRQITYYEATLGPFTVIQGVMGMVASTYILWLSYHYYRQGYRREATPLLLALGFMYAAAVNDTLVSQGVYQFVYAIEYSYLAMILLMAYSLSSTVVEAAMAKESLRASEERFRSLVETTSDWVWEMNPKGAYTYVSPKVRELLGYEPEEIVGKTPFDFMPPDEVERLGAVFQNIVDSHNPIERLENTAQHKDGRLVVLETSGVPFFDASGKLLGYRGIDRDITERKQAESVREALITELEAKNAELERFTYTVSHDLKSPLITIGGFVGFLEKDALSGNIERVKADLTRIKEALARMQRLLDELLELSRIGRIINPPEVVSFEVIAREAVELARGRITARGVKVEIAPDLPTVYGDRVRLVEVMQNLVDNACKFMGEQPQPRIEIGVRQSEARPVFYVRDNGIGIETQYQNNVFGLFDKLDPQTEGTGVGLALVKRIVETHGGKIWVESEGVGRGSAFCFTLADVI
jgi:PAS domain S-box-containing protein